MTDASVDSGPCVGVDIGGTAIRLVLWRQGRYEETRIAQTDVLSAGDPAEPTGRLAGMISGLVPDGEALVAVGIGASGPVDVARGVIENPYTLPAISGLPIVADLQRLLGCPVLIESDAIVAAVGEHRVGAGVGASRMVMVTLGTGIGVCLLIDGKPFRGLLGAHPEGGHIPIVSSKEKCYCGVAGCWEQVASRAALQLLLQPHVKAGTPPAEVLEAAAAAAPASDAVRAAFTSYGRLLGRGLAALQGLYMPDVVVLGGSAATYLTHFRGGMDEELSRPPGLVPPISVRAALMKEPGAIGAALLAKEHFA